MKYTIICDGDFRSLITKVQEAIALGWEPIGGVSIEHNKASLSSTDVSFWKNNFYQALVQKES